MGVFAGPEIVESGLVLALDAGNSKGFDDDENLYTYSKDFSSGWSANQVTIVANSALAPDGTNTAALITTNTVAAYNTIEQVPTLSTNTNYCYSVFVKLVSGSGTSSRVVFGSANDLVSPAYVSWGLQLDTLVETSDGNTPTIKGYISYPNGWYRIYMVLNTSTQTNALVSIRFGTGSADNVATFYVWGAQVERGSSASPYYPTTASAKNRGTTLIDMTGRGNSGTLTNGPTYSSANGGSIVFDGTNDYVLGTINGSIFTGSFTQSAWIYKLNNNQIWQGVFTNSSPATNNTYLMTFGNGSVAAPFNSVGANQVGISESGVFLDIGTHTNRWLYIVMTKTGSTLNIYCYKDGTLLQTSGTINWNGGNFATTNNYEIGRHWASGLLLQGNVSQVSVYNRALTAAEVQQNFIATRSRYSI